MHNYRLELLDGCCLARCLAAAASPVCLELESDWMCEVAEDARELLDEDRDERDLVDDLDRDLELALGWLLKLVSTCSILLALLSLFTLLAACFFDGWSGFGVGLGPFDAAVDVATGLLVLVSGLELVELAVWPEADDELDAEWVDEEDEDDTDLDDRLDGIDSSVLSATVGLLLLFLCLVLVLLIFNNNTKKKLVDFFLIWMSLLVKVYITVWFVCKLASSSSFYFIFFLFFTG